MRKTAFLLLMQCLCFSSFSQYSITGAYNQDFNSLSNSGTGNSLPAGWAQLESGTAADLLYSAGTGSGSTGDTYSFGNTASTDRALGTLLSGTLQSTAGFYFTNATGNTISRLTVTYTGEQWRLGATGRTDRLDFQFSLNAASLATGDWVNVDLLDFSAPVSSSPAGALDGNNSNNRRLVTATITGIQLAPGSTCFFRWLDADAAGSDDGLAIDDFSIEPGFTIPSALHYRSVMSGNWSSLSTWEVSADENSWSPATELPTWYAHTIRIRNGHTITYQYFSILDQLIIESGGLLQHTGGQLSLNDGPDDELQVENGAIFQLAAAGNLPVMGSADVSIRIKSGGILRISAGGLSTVPGAGVHATQFVYEHAAVLESAYNGFGANGVTYFPNVNSSTIPVLRIAQPITLPVGATAATRVNGILEVNGNISFTASGQKILRNGIRGTANLSTTATSGILLIDGNNAILGGTGQLNLSASAGLQLGSGTTLSLEQDKLITGHLTLGASSSYVDPGVYTLTVTGTVNGGGSSSFIRTTGSGSLALTDVGIAGKLFPVGHSRYNPVLIEKGSGYRWAVRVKDGVVPDFPYTDQGAVLLTWHIEPEINPTAAAADITFRFDQLNQTGALFNAMPYSNEPVQAWHRSNGFWLSVATPQPLVNAGGDIRSVKIPGLTDFSDFGLSRISLPLPVKLISFQAIPIADHIISLQWRIATTATALFIPERSENGVDFLALDTISGDGRVSFVITDQWNRPALYRLKIIEPGGAISYSETVRVKTDLSVIPIRLIDNPVTQDALLLLKTDKTQIVEICVTHVSGKTMLHRFVELHRGDNTISIPSTDWSRSIYYLHITNGGWRRTIRMVKK